LEAGLRYTARPCLKNKHANSKVKMRKK
jgi:hypothetical protein